MPRFLSVTQNASTAARAVHGVLTGAAGKRLAVTALAAQTPDGTLPAGIEPQVAQAFSNLATLVAAAGLRHDQITAVRVFVTEPGAAALVGATAAAVLSGLRPPPAVRLVLGLSSPDRLIEIDAEVVGED